jgi:signal transduction histidine kinase
VEDDGIGMTPEQIPHVFERFFRGDVSRTRGAAGASQGAGLGLSIAEWIATEHGATIQITSQLGRGTRVAVNFPVAIADAV